MTITERYDIWLKAKRNADQQFEDDDQMDEALMNLKIDTTALLSAWPETKEDLAMQVRAALDDPEFALDEWINGLKASSGLILMQAGIHAGEARAA